MIGIFSITSCCLVAQSFLGSEFDLKSVGKRNNNKTHPFPHMQISISYWNDNFFFQRQIRNLIESGDDDFMTASFQLQVARWLNPDWWYGDIFFTILTNREEAYRTDLLAVRLIREWNQDPYSLRLGSGAIIQGKFGGKQLQNWYHDLYDYKTVDLQYSKIQNLGFMFYFRGRWEMVKNTQWRNAVFLANSYRSAAGPSHLRTGLVIDYYVPTQYSQLCFKMEGLIGYVTYYHLDSVLDQMFDQGLMWGGLTTVGWKKGLSLSVWMTKNQYGLQDPHFGLSVTFGWIGTSFWDLSDSMFP